MSELAILRALRARLGPRSLLGDDCAVLPPPRPGHEFVVTTDLYLEDVHFRRRTHSASEVGHNVLARGLSDLAAMGAAPLYCFVSLAVPKWADQAWVRDFYTGLLALARRTRTRLAGGDLSRTKTFAADIVAIGETPRRKALRRSAAKPGDGIYVSGLLGGSPRLPEPRLALGRYLRGKAAACMDLSDGLALDLHRLARESGVMAIVDRPLPVASGATLDQALYAGEDYELLFTAPDRVRIPARHANLPLTRIGAMAKGKPGRLLVFGQDLQPQGWDPFR